jgi:serine/threonine-protein kinase
MNLGSAELLDSLRRACEGRYDIERPIGQGGTAMVFLARDLRHPRQVAIKVLDPGLAAVVGSDRFRREIEIAARLNHPHILSLIDSGELRLGETRVPFYVMPFIEGQTLRDRLAEHPRLPVAETVRIISQAADALAYAHRAGVVHRDIKPENILLQADHAIVSDFGVSRAIDEAGERMTRTGFSPGTPHYMSPEQLAGESDVDARADLYALGCIAFEMLAGRSPFAGGSLQAMLARRLTETAPTLSQVGVSVPPTVEAAIAKAMARERENRFASAAEFAAALVATNGGGRGSRWGAVAAMVVVPVAVAVAVVLSRDRPSAPRTTSPRLAIRPLVSTDRDPGNAYLSEGIHEGVADRLRRVTALSLTAPSLVSELLARQPDLDLRELGRRLGVDAVLTWTMRRLGDSVHLRAELVSSGEGELVWGESFDRSIADVPRLQNDIVRAIADTLGLSRDPALEADLERRGRVNPGAYDAYLRGYYVWLKATPLGARGAREKADSVLPYARRAIELDSTFAGGYFLLGAYYTLAGIRGWREPFAAILDSARMVLDRALARDSMMADPWVLQGVMALYTTDDWATARSTLSRAVRLNPDLASAENYYAIYLAEIERQLDSAVTHLNHAIRRDRQHQLLNSLGDVLMRARRYDSAVVVLRAAIDLDSTPPGPHGRLIQSYEALGRYREAVEARRRAPDSTGAGRFAEALARGGSAAYLRERNLELDRRIEILAKSPPPKQGTAADGPPLREQRLASLYLQRGLLSQAMDWIEREYQRRPRRFRTYFANPDFDALHADPRFQALARREGLIR